MENDGFLEFKWKGDQFLIFGSCGICIGSFSDFAAALGFFFFLSPTQMGDEGRQVSLEWKEGRREPFQSQGKWTTSTESLLYSDFRVQVLR